jgi:DNA-binding beta-propeller fold protein YncE
MKQESAPRLWLSVLLFLFVLYFPSVAPQHSPNLVLGFGIFNNPSGVAVDPNSDALFVVDNLNDRVLRFNDRSILTDGSRFDFVFGVNTTTDGSSLNGPLSVWVDDFGNLWVADAGNNRVLALSANAQLGPPTALKVFGQGSFTGNLSNQGFANPTATTMSSPGGVMVDSNGTLWVADSGNNR